MKQTTVKIEASPKPSAVKPAKEKITPKAPPTLPTAKLPAKKA